MPWLIAAAAVVCLGLGTAVCAGDTLACGGAFVDRDHDGACGPADVPLLPLLQAHDRVFDASSPIGAYVPPTDGSPVDLVIDTIRLPFTDPQNQVGGVIIRTTGKVHVSRLLTAKVYVEIVAAHIDVADGAHVEVAGRYATLGLFAGNLGYGDTSGAIQIGRRARIRFNRDGMVEAGLVTIGDDAVLEQSVDSARGHSIYVHGRTLQIGRGVRVHTAARGMLEIDAFSDVTARAFRFQRGALSINVGCDALSPGQKHIRFDDSRFSRRLVLTASSCGVPDAPDAIVLHHCRIPADRTFAPPPQIER